ncbi:cytidylyltransferase domain-containing protein [Pusillimonas sp. ANT_WB101]|uniref:acylneuraminate cytidylyltransferase family protein n=1 Tax=Pusillimonas sp. ANT_WB101 TaxID=2597356 RepID=UPI0011EBF099|nr:acylneuraminate cytidylyltransferase family protein [Pusillimonas sp. ANT_WB101]KAA0911365.1 acylneuraminate cytidylyltransferase family protein [Pusillimonas sp. ANT_WB101]
MSRFAIVPARSNSKGVPGKNLRTVGGVSLVARAIQTAAEAGIFSDIVLTTDGEEIAEEGRRAGARVVMRPAALAGDDAKSIDAVCHALEYMGVTQGIAVLLQPTSPLRSVMDIVKAVQTFEDAGQGCVISVCECEHHPFKTFYVEEAAARPLHDFAHMEQPRQLLPPMSRPNGAIYVNTVADLLRKKSFFVSPVTLYEMSATASIDIDTETDLLLANTLIRNY